MAIADYLRKLVELKNQFVANLNSMGVTADESEKLNTLVPKVLDIETGVDTSDATATAEDIAVGKTAYAKDEKITGTKKDVVQNVEFSGVPDGDSTINGFWKSITKVNLLNFRSFTRIGDYGFINSFNLKSIIIPDSVTYIGYRAFYDCYSLANIYYTGTEEQWNAITKEPNWDSYMGMNVTGGTTIHYNYVLE